MRSKDLLPIALLGGIAIFVAVQATSRSAPPPAAVPDVAGAPETVRAIRGETDSATTVVVEAGQLPESLPQSDLIRTLESSAAAPERDLETVRGLIRDGAAGTYIIDMLAEQDQLVMRWPERRMDALRVWIEREPSVPDWDTSYPLAAERAFEEWQRASFPMRFDIVRDSANSEIQIRWIAAFPDEEREKLGMARKTRDQHGWLRAAEITIATHDRSGRPLPAGTVAGTARHEIGHALGLGHSPNETDVMFAESRTTVISAVDRATLRLLYILPPGSLK